MDRFLSSDLYTLDKKNIRKKKNINKQLVMSEDNYHINLKNVLKKNRELYNELIKVNATNKLLNKDNRKLHQIIEKLKPRN